MTRTGTVHPLADWGRFTHIGIPLCFIAIRQETCALTFQGPCRFIQEDRLLSKNGGAGAGIGLLPPPLSPLPSASRVFEEKPNHDSWLIGHSWFPMNFNIECCSGFGCGLQDQNALLVGSIQTPALYIFTPVRLPGGLSPVQQLCTIIFNVSTFNFNEKA
jgi:hypothetical protein